MKSKAKKEGRTDYETKEIYENPYEFGSDAYKEWRAGFISMMEMIETPLKDTKNIF